MGLVGVPFEGGFRLGRGWVGRERDMCKKRNKSARFIFGVSDLGRACMGRERERELCARKVGFFVVHKRRRGRLSN